MKLSADIPLGPGFTGFGSLGNPKGTGIDVFTKFLSSAIGLMTIIAVIWFIFVFVTGAIGWITAGGDKTSLEAARKKISTGLVGLAVTVAAIFIIEVVGSLIGIPDILKLPALFEQIQK
jgi:hypothetical protein